MTQYGDNPMPLDEDRPQGKGRGCVMGGLFLLAASFAGVAAAAAVTAAVPDSAGSLATAVSTVVYVGLVVWAVFRWKSIPGFVLGVVLAVVIPIVVVGACAAVLVVTMGVIT